MRDNLFHASTAESIGSRHAETYRRKMRSAKCGRRECDDCRALNSPISEERERAVPSSSRSSADPPRDSLQRVFVYLAAREAAIFHPINRQTEALAKNGPPSLAEAGCGRCNLSRNHFYRSGVISSPKARAHVCGRRASRRRVDAIARFALSKKRQVRSNPR